MKVLLELKDKQFVQLMEATNAINQLLFRDFEKLEHRGSITKLTFMKAAHDSKRFQLGFLPLEVNCWQDRFDYDEVLSLILSFCCQQVISYEGFLTEDEREQFMDEQLKVLVEEKQKK